jgi:cell division protein FtsN
MTDDDFRADHEFDDVDKEKLEEFERELTEESKKKKRKLYLIAGGTAVCAATLLFFSGWIDQNEPAKPPAPVKASAGKAPDTKAPEDKPQNAQADAEMEAVQKKNIVEADSKAPGVAPQTASSPDKEGEAKPAGEKNQKKTEKSKPSAEPKSAQAPVKKPAGFVLQAVATSDADRALSARDDLAVKGYKSWISIGKVKESVFVVEAGEFASIKDAAPQKEKLEKAGFEPRVAQSGGKTALVAGVFQDKAGADAVAERVKAVGFTPKVMNRKEPSDLYLVRVGPYASAEEAKKAGEAIKTAGYAPVSVIQ